MNYERIKTEYLCYLMNRAHIEAEGDHGYFELCKILQATAFFPMLEMDENRSYDCRELRSDYAEEYDEYAGDILDGLLDESGTMMELLVVLAERFGYDLMDSEYEASTRKWFLEMLENCGLVEACNEAFQRDDEEEIVKEVLDVINLRKFGWDGEGGLFPLQWAHQDQRETELLVQMNYYIEENYDIC